MKKIVVIALLCTLMTPQGLFAQASVKEIDTVKLVVTGTGNTEDDAIRLAVNDAIRQVYLNAVSKNTQHLSSISEDYASYEKLGTFILPDSHKYQVFLKVLVPINTITEYAKSAGSNAELSTASFGKIIKLQELQQSNADSTIHRMFKVLRLYTSYMYDFDLKVNNFSSSGNISLTAYIKANKNTRNIGNFIFNILKALASTEPKENLYQYPLWILQSSPINDYYSTLLSVIAFAEYTNGIDYPNSITTMEWSIINIRDCESLVNDFFTDAAYSFKIIDNFSNEYVKQIGNDANPILAFPRPLNLKDTDRRTLGTLQFEIGKIFGKAITNQISPNITEKEFYSLMPDTLINNINGTPQGVYNGRLYLPFMTEIGDTVASISLNLQIPKERMMKTSSFTAIPNKPLDQQAEILPSIDKIENSSSKQETYDYDAVEEKPSFNGGDANEFVKWFYSHLKYPEAAYELGISGLVVLQITIETDGSVSAKVLRSVDPSLDNEALRVARMSPKWEPAKIDGEAVRVTYNFPVRFQRRD